MAHISIRRQKSGGHQISINGIDFSMEVYDGSIDLVEVGDHPGSPHNEIGLRLTVAVTQLDLDNKADVPLTDRFPAAAALVRSIQGRDGAVEKPAADFGQLAEQQARIATRLAETASKMDAISDSLSTLAEDTGRAVMVSINSTAARGRRDGA